MQVWMLWHGGSSYASPRMPEDLERFDSIAEAKRSFDARADSSATFYPCVEREPSEDGGQSAWLYFYDPSGVRDPYPDRILEYGPRGGLMVSFA
jgi:hypothetical protein